MEPEPGAPRASGGAGPRLDPRLDRHFARPLLHQLRQLRAQVGSRGRRLPVLALNGPVGAGKSTLGRHLEALAPSWGLRLVVASIDDLYLTWPQRQQRLAGNPFGVSRVPPGSHDVPLLLGCLQEWRCSGELRLPQFDKTLAGGQGDRSGWRRQPCDALVLEGWLMGCRPLAPEELSRNGPARNSLAAAGGTDPLCCALGAPELHPAEWDWLPRWNRELAAYQQLWDACDGLWVLRPQHWGRPRRWRLQAEARQRRAGGGWLPAAALESLVRSSLCSLPPALYQDPLLRDWAAQGLRQIWPPLPVAQLPGLKPAELEPAGLEPPQCSHQDGSADAANRTPAPREASSRTIQAGRNSTAVNGSTTVGDSTTGNGFTATNSPTADRTSAADRCSATDSGSTAKRARPADSGFPAVRIWPPGGASAAEEISTSGGAMTAQALAAASRAEAAEGGSAGGRSPMATLPLQGVALLDGRRRCLRALLHRNGAGLQEI
ncbi:MAG: hypothetical protein ACKOXO_04755 [Cyanobium sp.]